MAKHETTGSSEKTSARKKKKKDKAQKDKAKKEKMVRLEIVANRSVQEDLFERLRREDLLKHYTLFPEVQGDGTSGPRRGDHIWPEENFVMVAYVTKAQAVQTKAVIQDLKQFFTDEGIRIFATRAVEL